MSNVPRRPGRRPSTPRRMAKALAHPVRIETLRILAERMATPSEIAEELDVPVSNVTYHMRRLQRFGCVDEVAHASQLEDAEEHRYRAVQRPLVWADEWDALPEDSRDDMTRSWLGATIDDLHQAGQDALLDALPERHLSRVALRLDEQAFDELSRRLDEVLDWALGQQAEAAVRLAGGGEGGAEVGTRMILCQFGRPVE